MPVTISGNQMPCQFKYIPLIPEKRKVTKITATGTVTQSFNTPIIGTGDIPFELTSTPDDAIILNTLYYSTAATMVFSGYYGDVYEGYISKLDQPMEGGWVKSKGIFKVVCTTTQYTPTRNCS